MRYLFYHGEVNEAGVRNLEALLAVALNESESEVTLCLASNGGNVNAGIGLYNFIEMLPLAVHTHAAGICDSIAATIMLAGTKRTAAPVSAFTIHAATYSEGPKKGEAAPNTDLISAPFRDKLNWSDGDIAARFTPKDFRLSADEAKALGLIDEITSPVLGRDDQMITVRLP